jgi:hypothetical protein
MRMTSWTGGRAGSTRSRLRASFFAGITTDTRGRAGRGGRFHISKSPPGINVGVQFASKDPRRPKRLLTHSTTDALTLQAEGLPSLPVSDHALRFVCEGIEKRALLVNLLE